MRRMKTLTAVAMLVAVMTLGVPQARAGFILTGFAEQPPAETKGEVIKQRKPISVIKGIILTLEGILMSD